MENKEIKNSVPMEIDDEKLDMVTGGSQNSYNPLPFAANDGLIIDYMPEDD